MYTAKELYGRAYSSNFGIENVFEKMREAANKGLYYLTIDFLLTKEEKLAFTKLGYYFKCNYIKSETTIFWDIANKIRE
jgi:hypothetical protein